MEQYRSLNNPAIEDFHRARRQAALQEVMARFKGQSTSLLSFNEVSEKLKAGSGLEKGIQEIPLSAIVGSCDRYQDFTRTFLPRQESDKERWGQVRSYVSQVGLPNVPPILVYQIGEVYFVLDGNHRVSVARQMEATTIRANVTELQTRVGLSPTDQAADLILKAEITQFLERSGLDVSRPQADLQVTVPGKYWIIEAQIEAHQFLAAGSAQQPLSFEEAAQYWYDGVYLGVVQVIRDRNLLQQFPNRTETDLYLWSFEHRATLKEQVNWDMDIASVLTDLKAQHGDPASGTGQRLKQRVKRPQRITGQWQREKSTGSEQSRLFFNVLVAITGEEKGWQAFEQSVEIAKRERGRLRGLHLLPADNEGQGEALQAEFERRCLANNIPGQLSVESGPAVDKLCERAWLADLVVAPLLNPPGPNLTSRLSSEFRSLIQRCARPVLAVPDKSSSLTQALLAYDGGTKAKEALFVAAYLAGHWQLPLLVLTVAEDKSWQPAIEAEARRYLESRQVQARFVHKQGRVAEAVLNTAETEGVDFLIMGGHSRGRVKDLILGSSVDGVLSHSPHPILICQ